MASRIKHIPAKPFELISGAYGVWSATKRMWTLKFYKDRRRQWRWTLLAGNGRKIANSGEGYKNRRDAITITRKILPWFFALE